jgi:phosphocarrier protein
MTTTGAVAPPRPPSAVLLDFDGTLVLSEERNARIWDHVFDRIGYRPDATERHRLLGRRLHEIAVDFPPVAAGTHTVADVERLYRGFDAALPRHDVVLAPGVRAFLERLAARGIPVAVVSSAHSRTIAELLEAEGLTARVTTIVGGENSAVGKPDPAPYREALGRLSIPAAETVAVEDSPVGLASARGAGVFAVGILTTHRRDELALADLVVDSFDELAHGLLPDPFPDPIESETPMLTRTAVVGSTGGLHARPAAQFVKAVKASGIPVTISKPGGSGRDAASILTLLALDAQQGEAVELTAGGDDAERVLGELVALVESNLDVA